MILSIESSIPTFKTLTFKEGLNVLLADARDKASSGKTRNSAGKTSFVEIVDFLLGANCPKTSLFRAKALVDETFRGRFIVGGETLLVERTGADYSKIYILEGAERMEADFKTDLLDERTYLQLSEWKRYLGHVLFGLPARAKGTDFALNNAPSYRAMLGYFLRLDRDGGFFHPERQFANQQRSSWQACLSYMFDLEWRISQEFQAVRDREKTLESLKKAADGGVIGAVVGTVAKLRPLVALAEKNAAEKRKEIANFEVLESYKDLSDNAAIHQGEMQGASRRLVSLKETLNYLEGAIANEKPSQSVDLKTVYEASGIELPDLAVRRFEEVSAFHESIIENRRIHLHSEIDVTQRQIAEANAELAASGSARKQILISLQGKGAFEDLVGMQRDLARIEAEHASLIERFKAAEKLEGEGAELKVDRIELQRRLQADHATHSEKLNAATLRISELISKLYDNREGRFEIAATDNGPEFNIHIEGDRGSGIRSMEIYCMDIALFEAVHSRFNGPGFLIHDSHLFDGVDARQILSALLIGQTSASELRQYIVTLNSDIYESLPFPEDFDPDAAILPARLSDEGETGGLFGFRFD